MRPEREREWKKTPVARIPSQCALEDIAPRLLFGIHYYSEHIIIRKYRIITQRCVAQFSCCADSLHQVGANSNNNFPRSPLRRNFERTWSKTVVQSNVLVILTSWSHERNEVLDELSENSKKCAILRLVYARGLLSSFLNGLSNCTGF